MDEELNVAGDADGNDYQMSGNEGFPGSDEGTEDVEGAVDATLDNLAGDATGEDDGDGENPMAKIAELEANLKKLTQKNRTLEGLFKSNNLQTAKAENAELKQMIQDLIKAQQRPEQTGSKQTLLSGDVRKLFGDQADEFETAMFTPMQEIMKKLSALEAQIGQTQRIATDAPVSMVLAEHAETLKDPGFLDYIDESMDETGTSLRDRVTAIAASDRARGASAYLKAIQSYKAHLSAKQKKLPTIGKQVINPRTGTIPAAGQKNGPKRDADIATIRSDYQKLISQPMTQAVMAQRVSLATRAAQLGVNLHE